MIELADFEKNVNKQVYKYNAYRKASRSVLNYPNKITKKEQIKELVSKFFIIFVINFDIVIIKLYFRKELVRKYAKKLLSIFLKEK